MSRKDFTGKLTKLWPILVDHYTPYLHHFATTSIGNSTDFDFIIAHTGGRRILDELQKHLGLSPDKLQHSRESLREHGNTSSVSVIDVLHRHYLTSQNGEKGIVVAFGPGFTSEVLYGQWQS
ncbi:3-oxoacyl-[acyl-carrier-protein] synthase III C-terminal domain-containing protein [Vibrio coralliilyticus]|uniref:3-oxoacyl-[acyl-carrier-protein] synthase III C-terminal domain-containing protein n=1 Tax=Vibrio coralliilyticus TaxID=190893 RepID=UPI001F5BD937|nr:3-oxoacyl-[acyl-carrier-protein] synthase III C-terminal domain-containing protein [Vibrio coralliilyticus]